MYSSFLNTAQWPYSHQCAVTVGDFSVWLSECVFVMVLLQSVILCICKKKPIVSYKDNAI